MCSETTRDPAVLPRLISIMGTLINRRYSEVRNLDSHPFHSLDLRYNGGNFKYHAESHDEADEPEFHHIQLLSYNSLHTGTDPRVVNPDENTQPESKRDKREYKPTVLRWLFLSTLLAAILI